MDSAHEESNIYSENHWDDKAMRSLSKDGIYTSTASLQWNGHEAGFCGPCIDGEKTGSTFQHQSSTFELILQVQLGESN